MDFEHGLNAAVKRLRDGLGDSAETPTFVETVPRRGYRFIAAVERSRGHWLGRRRMLVIAGALLAALAAAGVACAAGRLGRGARVAPDAAGPVTATNAW